MIQTYDMQVFKGDSMRHQTDKYIKLKQKNGEQKRWILCNQSTEVVSILLCVQGGPATVRPTYIFDGNI